MTVYSPSGKSYWACSHTAKDLLRLPPVIGRLDSRGKFKAVAECFFFVVFVVFFPPPDRGGSHVWVMCWEMTHSCHWQTPSSISSSLAVNHTAREIKIGHKSHRFLPFSHFLKFTEDKCSLQRSHSSAWPQCLQKLTTHMLSCQTSSRQSDYMGGKTPSAWWNTHCKQSGRWAVCCEGGGVCLVPRGKATLCSSHASALWHLFYSTASMTCMQNVLILTTLLTGVAHKSNFSNHYIRLI